MAWDGNGSFSRTNGDGQTGANTWQDADAAGHNIDADEHDAHDQDLATGIQACLTKNNESKPTADFKPNADNQYKLGSASLRWQKLCLAGSNPALNLVTGICEGRLTLTSGTPVTTTDVTAAETLYFTPYKGNRIALYDGTDWELFAFSELSIDVPDATSVYDVFVYNNSGTLTLELTAWTNDTTRATALTTQNGVLVKNGATTRRYLGSFYSTTAGNGQIEDSAAKRNLWNYYNRVERPLKRVDGTDSWTYTTATLRQARADTANQLEYVQGVSEDAVEATCTGIASNGTAGVGVTIVTGIGVDSTSVNSASLIGNVVTPGAGARVQCTSFYKGFPGVGRHTLVWLEYSGAADTTTWRGDAGDATLTQAGIIGSILG